METIGIVEAIWRYPVKALRGEALARAQVTAGGIAGDRAAALFVRSGHARTGKTLRGKEHDRLHLIEDVPAAVAAANERGIAVELRDDDAHYFDAAPISLLVDRWLDGLNAHVGYRVEPLRFRPNFFVRASASFDADETALIGAELAIGDVRLRVRETIGRCAVPTYDLAGGPSDPRILRYVAQRRDNRMGVYCDVVHPGTAEAGAAVLRRY